MSFSSEAQILDGYTDKQSYRAGETVTFFINGFNPFGMFNQIPLVTIDGTVPLFISGFDNMTIQVPTTAKPWQDGFGYSATNTFVVPSTLKSGLYFVGNIPLIIKGDNTTADVVVVCPTNTINAYTSAGGRSLYIDEADGDCDASTNTGWSNKCNSVLKATTVSFHRPQAFGGGLMNGFLRWIFSQNYNVNVIADIDLDDVNEISNSKVIVVIGHSEYWTRQARLNLDQFVEGGKDAIILSGNSLWWQVRYEDENLNSDNNKLTCYRYNTPIDCNTETSCPCCSSLPAHPYDTYCDPLLQTLSWPDPTLKYSTFSSIGSDWLHGGYGLEGSAQSNIVGSTTTFACDYGGFYGLKVILPNSPILNGQGFSQGDVISIANGEYDGTLVKRDQNGNEIFDANGFPILDVSALSFFRAEMIAYDQTVGTTFSSNLSNQAKHYCPLIAFQRTCTSGKVINTNCNEWCDEFGIGGSTFTSPNCTSNPVTGDSRIPAITKNMIDLLLAGLNIFVAPPPTEFSITPASTTVSHSACITNGSIVITPCGVFMTEGYNVDQNDGSAVAHIEDCTSCNHTARMAQGNTNHNSTSPNLNNAINADANYHPTSLHNNDNFSITKKAISQILNFNVYPNPNNGHFTLSVTISEQNNYFIQLQNMVGQTIYENKSASTNLHEFDLSNQPKGVYFLNVFQNNKVLSKKIIVQ